MVFLLLVHIYIYHAKSRLNTQCGARFARPIMDVSLFKGNITARLESDPQTTVRHVDCSMFAQDEQSSLGETRFKTNND